MTEVIRRCHGADVWSAAELEASDRWIYRVDAKMRAELDAAIDALQRRGVAWAAIKPADFVAPVTARMLARVADDLENGPGIAKLVGLDLDGYDEAQRRSLLFGIGVLLGTPVSMSREGLMMSDVTDEGATSGDRYGQVENADGGNFLASRARVHSTGPLRFHNDRCDVVALLCVHQAAHGGANRIASVPQVHNEMLRRRPDLLRLLYAGFARSRLGEEFGDNARWYSVPVFAVANGRFTSHYSRTFIEAAQLNPEVPKMSDAQWQAIELMAEIADEMALETVQQPGEIQLLNNHVTFHSRAPYEDGPGMPRRLLHRLWLSMPNSRPLPDSFRVLFRETAPGAVRGGIPGTLT